MSDLKETTFFGKMKSDPIPAFGKQKNNLYTPRLVFTRLDLFLF